MNRMMLVYAAVIFIASVIIFTIGELNKDNEIEKETYRWMRILALVGIAIAVFCAIVSRSLA